MFKTQILKFTFTSQKFLILCGAPGVGKGTYSKLIRKQFNFTHISTGDQIRNLLKSASTSHITPSEAQSIRSIISTGGLLSDDLVLKIISSKISQSKSSPGFILDGFPRTIPQLIQYQKLFPIHCVLNFTLRDDFLLQKLLGRRTCKGCGEAYNVCGIDQDGYRMPPILPKKEDGRCDKCGRELGVREDDEEGVIRKRMKQYEDKTIPLLTEYEERGVLRSHQAKHGVDDYPEMRRIILDMFKKKGL